MALVTQLHGCGASLWRECSQAGQALEIVRTPTPVQLVLSDVAMPEMRGTQLVTEVLQLSPQTAGLLMTGDVGSLPDVPEGVTVIRKPFSPAELILAVRSTLVRSAELYRRMRELTERNKQLKSELQGAVEKSIETRERSSDTCR